jgi:hypothetical protein
MIAGILLTIFFMKHFYYTNFNLFMYGLGALSIIAINILKIIFEK